MSSNQTPETVLGADCVIRGEMATEGDAIVLGQIEGELRIGGVLDVSADAHARGTVIAAAVRLAGTIDGDVVAEHGIEMTDGATLNGRLFATRLSIAEGAAFEGDINVGPDAMRAAKDAMAQPRRERETPKPAAGAPTPLRLHRDEDESSNPGIIGSLLNQRRSRVMSAARVYEQTIEQTPAI